MKQMSHNESFQAWAIEIEIEIKIKLKARADMDAVRRPVGYSQFMLNFDTANGRAFFFHVERHAIYFWEWVYFD